MKSQSFKLTFYVNYLIKNVFNIYTHKKKLFFRLITGIQTGFYLNKEL